MASLGVAEWLVRWRKGLQNADIPEMYQIKIAEAPKVQLALWRAKGQGKLKES